MARVLIDSGFWPEDLQYVAGGENLELVDSPAYWKDEDRFAEFADILDSADLFIFRSVGRMPDQLFGGLKSAGLWERFRRSPAKKVFWTQDSHHQHTEEIKFQEHFDRYYIAHANYMSRFDSSHARYLPCCVSFLPLEKMRDPHKAKVAKKYDLSSCYVQYEVFSRDIIANHIHNLLKKRGLSCVFGKYYGGNSIFEHSHGNMLLCALASDIILNIPIMDDMNIRNFEAIALNKKLLTIQVPDHERVNLNYENSFFFKRSLCDFEEVLDMALEHDASGIETWRSVFPEHMLISRYLEIINNELGTAFHLDLAGIPDTGRDIDVADINDLITWDDVEVYTTERMFARAFAAMIDLDLPAAVVQEAFERQAQRLMPLDAALASKELADCILRAADPAKFITYSNVLLKQYGIRGLDKRLLKELDG